MGFEIHMSNKADRLKEREVRCNACGKKMKAPKAENPPYYCYYCAGAERGEENFRR